MNNYRITYIYKYMQIQFTNKKTCNNEKNNPC